MILPVPFFSQPDPSSCLPACIKMALEYRGSTIRFSVLYKEVKTDMKGTYVEDALGCLSRRGFVTVLFVKGGLGKKLLSLVASGGVIQDGVLTWEKIKSILLARKPIIAAVDENRLYRNKANRKLPHTIVIVGFEDNNIFFLDPKCSVRFLQSVDMRTFFAARKDGCSEAFYIV